MNTPLHNFYAGPGKLPVSVLERMKAELTNYRDTNMSVMEISHRAAPIVDLIDETQEKIRRLLKLNPSDEVLFLQGGGTLQFLMFIMNLSEKGDKIDYIDTGYWAQKAIAAAQELERDVHIAGQSHTSIPKALNIRDDAKFLHLCSNNTVMGTQWFNFPDTKVPIIADMSSDILARDICSHDFGLIYAHAQKTIGTAGVTVVIIPEKTKGLLKKVTPSFLDYRTHIKAKSNYHTPPVFAIYTMNCMLDWLIEEIGGINKMEAINLEKSRILYEYLDSSHLFSSPVAKEDRSVMNVVFDIEETSLLTELLQEAENNRIIGIEGHRARGGLRASLYNAVSNNDVKQLVSFLSYFESTNRYT